MDLDKIDFQLKNSLGYVTNLVANRFKTALESEFLKAGFEITAHQWMILSVVYENNGLEQNELANLIKRDKTNVSRMLEKLETKELIVRPKSDFDKRATKIFITKNGKNLRKNLAKIASKLLDKSVFGMSENEQEFCIKTLMKIYANLS
nr:MarR family transcriptional regulator [Campylobacter sp.]